MTHDTSISSTPTPGQKTFSRRTLVAGSAAALTVAGLFAAAGNGFTQESTGTPGAASPSASPAASPAADNGATAVEVHTVDIAFEPKELTIPANTDVVVTIVNQGALQHDFAIDDLDIVSDLLNNGQETTVTINAAPGTYEYYCTVTGHREAGMVGTLTVE